MKDIIERGIEFIEDFACRPKILRTFAPDILFLFQHISQTTNCPDLGVKTRAIGKELSNLWREKQRVPRGAYQLLCTLIAEQAAHELGCEDLKFRRRLHQKITIESILEVLGFDPRIESPPANLTDDCDNCELINQPGRAYCASCRKKLTLISRYDVWLNALVMTHHLKLHGPIGQGLYANTLGWIYEMRPYPSGELKRGNEIWEAAYAITHIIYTLNDYGQYKLSKQDLGIEIDYLKEVIPQALAVGDCDLLGECVESLSFFGFSKKGLVLKKAVKYLKKNQNSDGSWGDFNSGPHMRIHTTWTVIDGLREFKLNRGSVSLKSNYPKAMTMVRISK